MEGLLLKPQFSLRVLAGLPRASANTYQLPLTITKKGSPFRHGSGRGVQRPASPANGLPLAVDLSRKKLSPMETLLSD